MWTRQAVPGRLATTPEAQGGGGAEEPQAESSQQHLEGPKYPNMASFQGVVLVAWCTPGCSVAYFCR